MFRRIWQAIGRNDDLIDKDVDRVLKRLDTDTPDAFRTRLAKLSGKAFALLTLAVKEQLKSESDPFRIARLHRLDGRMGQESERRAHAA